MDDACGMRSLLMTLALVLVATVGLAQERKASLVLEDGSRVSGPVVHLDQQQIVLRIGGDERAYRTEQIDRCVFERILDEQEGSAAGEVSAGPGSRAAGPGRPGHGGEDPDAVSVVAQRGQRLWNARMHAFDHRFPWLVPAAPVQWVSLGILLFALLSLAVHCSARLVVREQQGFGRGTLIGFSYVLFGLAQVALLPATPAAYALASLANVLLALLLYRVAYGLRLGGGMLALALLLVQAGLGYGALVLVDTTLRSIGHVAW